MFASPLVRLLTAIAVGVPALMLLVPRMFPPELVDDALAALDWRTPGRDRRPGKLDRSSLGDGKASAARQDWQRPAVRFSNWIVVAHRPDGLAATLAMFASIIAALIYFRARIISSPFSISAALWIAFMIYWSVAAGQTVPTKSRESRESRRVHERLFKAALLLMFVPVPGLDRRVLPVGSWVVVTGIIVHVASFLLAIWARRHLGRFWSGEVTQKVGHQLVRTGPYRLVRHPIYTAILGMFVGMAIVSGDLHAFVAVAGITAAYLRKIRIEERNLSDLFGATYDDYRRATRALVPWVI